jgi:hypothetical protein
VFFHPLQKIAGQFSVLADSSLENGSSEKVSLPEKSSVLEEGVADEEVLVYRIDEERGLGF